MKQVKVLRLYKNDYVIDDLNSEELDVIGYKYNEVVYDRQGNILEKIRYMPTGEVEEKTVNYYDDKGSLIEELYYVNEEELAEHKTFERDEKGRIQREIKHYLDGSKDVTSYSYDEQGHLLEKQTVSSDDELEGKEIYTYRDDKLINYQVLNGDESLSSGKEYTYDETGKIIAATEYYPEDFHRTRIVEKFDDTGRRTQSMRYNGNEQLVEKLTYSWVDQDRVDQVVEETPHGINTSHFIYDQDGSLIVQESYDRNNNLLNKIERKFDADHRLIESHVFIDGQGRGISQNYDVRYEYEFFEE
jgi:hypothetical protein